jgi:hypothetical protein
LKVTQPTDEYRTIVLRVPGAWIEVDLDPATTTGSIGRIVDERAQGDRGMLRAKLESATAEAVAQGAVYAALFFDSVGGRAVSASLLVSVIDAKGDEEAVSDPTELAGIRLAIAQGVCSEFGEAEVELRTLGAGPAARVRTRQPVGERGSGSGPEVEVLQYFIPFPQGDRLAVLTFSTPNVSLGDAFTQVFDAIAGTLQWTPS